MPPVLANPYVLAHMPGFSEPSANQYTSVAATMPGYSAPPANPYVLAAAPMPGYIETGGFFADATKAATKAVKSGGVTKMNGKTAQKTKSVPKNTQKAKTGAAEKQRKLNIAHQKARNAKDRRFLAPLAEVLP